jgi:hypothetical protein
VGDEALDGLGDFVVGRVLAIVRVIGAGVGVGTPVIGPASVRVVFVLKNSGSSSTMSH